MTLNQKPGWFEPKVTLGTIIQLCALLVGLWTGINKVLEKIDTRISGIDARLSKVEMDAGINHAEVTIRLENQERALAAGDKARQEALDQANALAKQERDDVGEIKRQLNAVTQRHGELALPGAADDARWAGR